MKKCIACSVRKPLNMFGKSAVYYDGHSNKCLDCQRKYAREYWLKNKKTISKRYAKWKKDNPDKAKYSQLKSLYGMTKKQYGVYKRTKRCRICKNYFDNGKRKKAVDHVEIGNKIIIRGTICTICNSAIGMLDHDPNTMNRGAKYCADFEQNKKAA